jgi:protein ImuB
MRTACLLVPELPLAAELRAHPELAGLPLAVASSDDPRTELVAISAEAARWGVRPLTSVAHARAVCGELRVRIASPALERAARDALLDAALSLSPRAAPGAHAGEAAVFLDASGVKTERGLATALVARAGRVGLPAVAAVASSRRAAQIAARRAREAGDLLILPPGSEAAFLAPLPIDVLDPDDALAEALTRFGVHRVRDLLALPRSALATRLGPRVLRLIALARGEEIEAPLPVPTRKALAEAIDLESPVDRLEPLTFVLRGLLSRLLARLESRHLACADLFLTLELEGGGRDARRIGAAAPTLDLRVLLRLVRHALEARPPEAPVGGAALETEGRSARSDQLDLFRPAGPAPAVLERILSELETLCGSGRIGAPEVADDHRPEAFGMGPFAGVRRRGEGNRTPPPQPPLAVRALRPPVPAEVKLFRGRPERIRSAVANGRVIRLAGPWRTTGGWWSREDRFAYDSFDVHTSDGSVARLRLDRIRKLWHIDAIYD